MAIQRLPLAAIQQVRDYIQSTLTITDTEQQSLTWAKLEAVDDMPAVNSLDDLSGVFVYGGLSMGDLSAHDPRNRWFISTVNPAAALLKFPGLSLKPNLRLVSYLYRTAEDGSGQVWAVPEMLSTTAQLEKAALNHYDRTQPPKPEGAIAHFMDAIQGDRSSASFVIASMFQRELQEFGAVGAHCTWTHHRLIDAVPPQAQWQWRTEQPKDLAPKVKVLPDGQAAIEFFTCRVRPPIALFRHVDQYSIGQYRANPIEKAIAIVQR